MKGPDLIKGGFTHPVREVGLKLVKEEEGWRISWRRIFCIG
jgi:hypothetical protein